MMMTFWCPRCGTIKDRHGVATTTNRDKLVEAAREVVDARDNMYVFMPNDEQAASLSDAIEKLRDALENEDE